VAGESQGIEKLAERLIVPGNEGKCMPARAIYKD
jgi:hypothetical protein